MTVDEGVIKYHITWNRGEPPSAASVRELMAWRDRLYDLGLIGAYEGGIGYGNVSQRLDSSLDKRNLEFVVSGTQTGHLPRLAADAYTRVTEFDLAANRLTCCGAVKASSESLTHAAIYCAYSRATAILHVHHAELWRRLLHRVPTTRAEVPYGTPQMAREMSRLFEEEALGDRRILAMAGHEDGVLSFGENLEDAGRVLLAHFNGLAGTAEVSA